MAEPTTTPVHVIAPADRPDATPPETVTPVTLFAGAGAPFGPAGNVSVRSTVSPLVIGFGPLFFTVMVQVTLPPALMLGDDTVLDSARSYVHGTQVMVTEPVTPGPAAAGDAEPAAPVIEVGTEVLASTEVARTKLAPPPPPAPVTELFVVEAPPPPPVYPPPPPPPLS